MLQEENDFPPQIISYFCLKIFENCMIETRFPQNGIYRECNTYKNPEVSLTEIDKMSLKIIWKCKRFSVIKTI